MLGLFLENYVHEDLGNTTIHVLSGEVLVELVDAKQNISLVKEKSLQVCHHLTSYFNHLYIFNLHGMCLFKPQNYFDMSAYFDASPNSHGITGFCAIFDQFLKDFFL